MTTSQSSNCHYCNVDPIGFVMVGGSERTLCKKHWWEYDRKFQRFFELQYQRQWAGKPWFTDPVKPAKKKLGRPKKNAIHNQMDLFSN